MSDKFDGTSYRLMTKDELREALAAANAKLSEMARLAEDSRSEALVLSEALAKANGALLEIKLACDESSEELITWLGRKDDIVAVVARHFHPQPPKEAEDDDA